MEVKKICILVNGEELKEINGVIINTIFNECEGIRRIAIEGGKYNFITSDGNVLSKNEDFEDAYDFCEDFAVVRRKSGEYNYLKRTALY